MMTLRSPSVIIRILPLLLCVLLLVPLIWTQMVCRLQDSHTGP